MSTETRTAKNGNPTNAVPADELARLIVIDRLEVGPPRVEPRRVIAPYTVLRDGKRHTTELIYRYEEDVFDDGFDARNLVAMMAAQVALNYGLFCKEIVFRGPYDKHDRQFLETYAENTAREIYVNKFLLPNPFLTGVAREMPVLKRDRFSHAKLLFVADGKFDRDPDKGARRRGFWTVDPSRHAVLSSGGKDSLLTFGLLKELGHDPHAIFINESGRHWYTALNAYRHFQAAEPNTAKVWTNSDRLFAWMLRHLPFVRQDFSRIRSDEYPIRLWTVAIFVFGALPLLRKRGIGRLLIGNEYDTTARTRYRGIPHYNALYDQSRLFDNDLSRYYRRKGWGVCQFSALRPLSELLIEKTLVERYPDLQSHQVSCHAAHLDQGRVKPCGKCEKCRRIVGMLEALGANPEHCGYSSTQVTDCLEGLVDHGVHQESVAAEQMEHMLQQRGLLPERPGRNSRAKQRPEALALRFDPVCSPVETIPRDLRKGLFAILLEHAGQALQKDGQIWVDFDPISESALSRAYPFEGRSSISPPSPLPGNDDHATDFLLAKLTWPEAAARFKQVDVALLPVGAIEQHGPHLPLDTDAYDADLLCKRVAAACSSPVPLVLPAIAYGVSYHHQDFSGTLSVSPETLSRLVHEIGMCAARCGVNKLIIVNGHGGNAPALHLAAQMINRDAHIFTCVDTGETSDTDIYHLVDAHNDVHAGEIETSTTLAVRPELVKMDKAPKMIPRFSSRYLDFTSKRSVGWYAYTKKISKSGVLGDATKATAEKGEKIWALMVERLVELVEDLKNLSLEEIHQKRY
jgi:creatinine amidohydrolase/Fe(II)-dependent formamide hydrolase-like protein